MEPFCGKKIAGSCKGGVVLGQYTDHN